MTVRELISSLANMPDQGAEVAFAMCEHSLVDVTSVELSDDGAVMLWSVGWSDDCDCE